MKKEDLLAKLRHNIRKQYDMPTLDIHAITYPDIKEAFIVSSKAVGSNVVEITQGEDVNTLIKQLYPEAKIVASNIEGIHATLNPDTIKDAAELDGTDVGVIQGKVGVAENGCVWVPQAMKERAVCFISESLVILLHKRDLVNNMHEAYRKIEMPEEYGYGTFISGPSKTADIEQALVMGAQAAKQVTIILLD